MALKLEVGKKYRTRGNEKTVTISRGGDDGRFRGRMNGFGLDNAWEADGKLAYIGGGDYIYDLVAEVLTLQPGRYYRTRDGRKAYVASVGNPFDVDYDCPAAGFICGDDVGCEWPLDGCGESETEIDLVEEWRDPPKTKTQTIALYEANGTICMLNYDSKEQARDIIEGSCGYKLLAVKEVTLTEGDGM